MDILGIETSCDETAASVIRASGKNVNVLSSIVSSQIKLHAKWGGVVPNLAAREHLKNILPVIESSLAAARTELEKIDLITVTVGPGLIPALLVGTNTAKTLAYVSRKPIIGIHHIEGHIYANFISNQKAKKDEIKFPVLCLVVSGGHTQLVLMKKNLHYQIIGQTMDDAAGEAFDKVARILGLGYPGGPAIAKKALENDPSHKSFGIKLPRPMINSNDFNFSFSGLKTAVFYATKNDSRLIKNKHFIAEMSREFQQAAIDVLVKKTIAAAKKYRPKTVMIAGGVSANDELRRQMESAAKKELPGTAYQIPDLDYSIDNAAMIATAGYYRWQSSKKKNLFSWENILAEANLILK